MIHLQKQKGGFGYANCNRRDRRIIELMAE